MAQSPPLLSFFPLAAALNFYSSNVDVESQDACQNGEQRHHVTIWPSSANTGPPRNRLTPPKSPEPQRSVIFLDHGEGFDKALTAVEAGGLHKIDSLRLSNSKEFL